MTAFNYMVGTKHGDDMVSIDLREPRRSWDDAMQALDEFRAQFPRGSFIVVRFDGD